MNDLKEIEISKHSGEEKFRDGSNNLDFNLLSFWQWSSSDVVSNYIMGILVEYIVGKALGCIKEEDIRDEWGAYDLPLKQVSELRSSQLHMYKAGNRVDFLK